MSGKHRGGVVAQNRKARYEYEIIETIEAGMVLTGSEVKSLRFSGGNITESYAAEKHGELFLYNSRISEYAPANRFNHDPNRQRKLLVTKKELARMFGLVNQERMTLIPLKIFFNHRGYAKIELGLAKGKKKHDKREAIKQRDWNRQKERALKDY